jgi:hypothetical protein
VKTSSDEAVLTVAAFKKMLGDCMSVEVQELVQILTKGRNGKELVRSRIGLSHYANSVIHEVGGDFTFDDIFVMFETTQGTLDYDSRAIIFTLVFGGPTEGYRTGNLPVLSYSLVGTPESYDEYGRIIEPLMKVRVLGWSNKSRDSGPWGSTGLFNSDTGAPVRGVTFNFGRYQTCINLKLGKYVPKN